MIEILMATYNGEKYLAEQLDSLLSQTEKDFRILIHDDGSSDRTPEIIQEFTRRYSYQIYHISDGVRCGSAVKNFLHLTKFASAEYIMYCDQDDVWLPEKAELSLGSMKETESRKGEERPILVFSAYLPVDAQLRPQETAGSRILPQNLTLNHLLVQNHISGCVMMCNRALYRLLGMYDGAILMHDWWAALIASAIGEIVFIPRTTTLYRQHGGNSVGAVDICSFRYRFQKLLDKETKKKKDLYLRQAALLRERFADMLTPEAASVLEDFLKIPGYGGKLHRMYALNMGGYRKSDFIAQVGFSLFI